ncbi:MAG: hypothetical protein AB1716_19500 [Planctomycetota bacterium]
MRRKAVAILAFLGGGFFILEFLIPAELPGGYTNPLTPYLGLATDLIIVLGAMAFLLGPISLIRQHVVNLARRQPNWSGSLIFLVFCVGSAAVSGLYEWSTVPAVRATLDPAWVAAWGPRLNSLYSLLFFSLGLGFGTTTMALLTFYLVSAAYRAFRLSGLDSGLMFVAGTIMLLGLAPVGDWMTAGLPSGWQLSSWADWLNKTPNAAVQRAVAIGTYAGVFAASLRFWLSLGQRRE